MKNKNNINSFVQTLLLTDKIQWNKDQLVSSHDICLGGPLSCELATNRKPMEVICKYE